jgi:diguanylate cyclase (GGDEF)-like protein
MAFYGIPRRLLVREAALVTALLVAALIVLALVLMAGSAARDAQRADQALADALGADRSLVELRLALLESPPDLARARAALASAQADLAQDRDAQAALGALASWTASPSSQDPAVLAAWSSLRRRLNEASITAERIARREAERARGITLAAGVLLVVLTVGTVHLILAEMRRRRRLAQSLEREANHDPLTRLPNRRFFLEWLSYALAQARRDDTRVALLYIDLDGFKMVNDRHGHRRGDAVLAAIAERLRANKREGDVLARIGGDEFAVAIPNARDRNEPLSLGERLLAALVDTKQPKLADVPLGASVGIAICPEDADDVPGLLAAADAAMYAAKRRGGQRVAFHGD